MKLKPIKLTRTEGEWSKLNQIAITSGKSDFNVFLRAELYKLKNRIKEEDCFRHVCGERTTKQVYIHEDLYNSLELLAERMKKPVASVVNEYIIAHLLYNKNTP